MHKRTAMLVSGFTIAVTGLSLIRSRSAWVRVADFPRLQIALLGTAALAHAAWRWRAVRRARHDVGEHAVDRPRSARSRSGAERAERIVTTSLVAAVVYQWLRIWRYTPLAPVEVESSRNGSTRGSLRILESNVRLSNRDADALIALVHEHSPDVVLCAETDDWWCERLEVLADAYPHTVAVPLDNTYGLVLRSRLPLADASVDFLTDSEVPSIQAKVRLRDGTWVWLNCVHPKPPAPGKEDDSLQRDSELMLVAKRVRDASLPAIVFGDLNDVAWSRTTRLFQKISGLLDPRKGRGFFSTFHAKVPGFRFPLDHFFHTPDFRLVNLMRLSPIGSDHFPMFIELSHEPDGAVAQPPVDDDTEDWEDARETLEQAGA